jgi:hypothetical protein
MVRLHGGSRRGSGRERRQAIRWVGHGHASVARLRVWVVWWPDDSACVCGHHEKMAQWPEACRVCLVGDDVCVCVCVCVCVAITGRMWGNETRICLVWSISVAEQHMHTLFLPHTLSALVVGCNTSTQCNATRTRGHAVSRACDKFIMQDAHPRRAPTDVRVACASCRSSEKLYGRT